MRWDCMAFFFMRLMMGLSAVSLAPLLFALLVGEEAGGFFLLTALPLGLAAIFRLYARRPDELTLREGIAVTGLSWLLASALGAVPYIAGGWLGVLDGLLESVSGFTGAGATVMPSLEALPRSVLLWRSLTHWVGGIGIIVFFIALLPQFGEGAARLFEAENAGPLPGRFMPRMKSMAQILFAIYAALSLAAALAYWAAGMSVFDALNHGMSTIATGGFSTHDDSAAYFHSPAIEWCMIVFMLLSSVNFSLYAGMLRRGVGIFLRSEELRFFLALVFGCTVIITGLLTGTGMDAGEALRTALFQTVTVGSTTGFVSADFDQWPPLAKCLLLVLMGMGGCAGSTAGGMKAVRVLLFLRLTGIAARNGLSPKTTAETAFDGRRVRREELLSAGYFFFIYVSLCLLWALIFIWDGSAPLDAVSLAMTTMSDVGPALGAWGATESYAALPDVSKIVVCLAMLLGRLEIFPVLAMLRPGFWRKERGWD
ncbi:MAG: TrkH family potassium uptake protein [Schwartzia sp.]|nr:TrkH family potassium uptake protein [Schwartzia sp. (in: firmicutes)]